MSRVPGRLHNLCLEIESVDDSSQKKQRWNAYSSHFVDVSARETTASQRLTQASQRTSVSPQKQRKIFHPMLVIWVLRLCQTREQASIPDKNVREDEKDSDTESDGEERGSSLSSSITAWYEARFDATEALGLSKSFGEDSWSTLELRLRVAWDGGCIDIMASEDEEKRDGTYKAIKLSFDSKDGEVEESGSGTFDVLLHRLTEEKALQAATAVSAELSHAYNALKSQTESLKQERDAHRKLLQNSRRHERFREGNSSLVNPGRLKRKTEDDEGFEGDEDDEG